jgi:hypothetical protein
VPNRFLNWCGNPTIPFVSQRRLGAFIGASWDAYLRRGMTQLLRVGISTNSVLASPAYSATDNGLQVFDKTRARCNPGGPGR